MDNIESKIDKVISILNISDDEKIKLPCNIEFKNGDILTINNKLYTITNMECIIETDESKNKNMIRIYHTKIGKNI